MHNNHFEAIALTQKLAFALTDKDFDAVDVAVLPPFTALRSVQTLVEGDKLRLALRRAGHLPARRRRLHRRRVRRGCWPSWAASYVLAGHSERRQYHGEDDALVNAKVKAALRAGHHARSCAWASRWRCARPASSSRTRWPSWTAAWPGLSGEQVAGLVIAYEPVWAIGTGEVATPEDAQEVLRRHPRPRFRRSRGRSGGQCAYPVWRVSEVRQHGCDHGAAGHRRRAWSAAPASMPGSSSGSAGIVN